MSQALTKFNQLKDKPFGKWLFSKLVGFMAPYFRSIPAVFQELRPGYCEIKMRNKRRIRNHLNTVHAIANCNLCELCGGTLVDASLPKGMRWIPKGMTVNYIAKATTKYMTATCAIPDHQTWTENGEKVVTVSVKDDNGVEVVSADITMYISQKPAKK